MKQTNKQKKIRKRHKQTQTFQKGDVHSNVS